MSDTMIRMCAAGAGVLSAPFIMLISMFSGIEDRALEYTMVAMLAASIALDVEKRLRRRG